MTPDNSTPPSHTQRWWQQRPLLGVMASLALGLATVWIAGSLEPPRAEERIAYLISLPIALLLPACALAGGYIAWQAWVASDKRPALAVPAFLAASANAIAIGLFFRVVVRLLGD
jgi:hypothetical protein